MVIGPNAGMAHLVDKHGLGIVAEDFSVDALAEAISSLTPATVMEFKRNSERAARSLSAEQYNSVWLNAVEKIVVGEEAQEGQDVE